MHIIGSVSQMYNLLKVEPAIGVQVEQNVCNWQFTFNQRAIEMHISLMKHFFTNLTKSVIIWKNLNSKIPMIAL